MRADATNSKGGGVKQSELTLIGYAHGSSGKQQISRYVYETRGLEIIPVRRNYKYNCSE